MDRLSAQRNLILGLVQTGEGCTSTSSTFAESATPKALLAIHRQGIQCTWVNSRAFASRYCSVELGSARKDSRPLRQLHSLKRFLSVTVGSQ